MTAPNVIWTASTDGKCHVGFGTPSLGYTNKFIRADAPELVALVGALRMARDLLEPFADQDLSLGLGDAVIPKIDAVLAAYEALK